MVQSVEMENDLIEQFKVLENEEGITNKMLLASRELCNETSYRWRQKNREDNETSEELPPQKPGFKVTLTRFRRDGTGYLTQQYRLDEISFYTKFDWDETNKVLCHEVRSATARRSPRPGLTG